MSARLLPSSNTINAPCAAWQVKTVNGTLHAGHMNTRSMTGSSVVGGACPSHPKDSCSAVPHSEQLMLWWQIK
jgi:hypothetical protein